MSTFSYSEYDRWADLAVSDPDEYRKASQREALEQVRRERERRARDAFSIGRKRSRPKASSA